MRNRIAQKYDQIKIEKEYCLCLEFVHPEHDALKKRLHQLRRTTLNFFKS